MALSHAILAALSGDPKSGYDLATSFRTSTGYFWHASRQQIYVELERLASSGSIAGVRLQQDKRPDKMMWSMTEAGRLELSGWLNRPGMPASIKEELVVKLYALSHADLDVFQGQLSARRDHHRERLSLFETISGTLAKGSDGDVARTGRLLAVKAGIAFEGAMLEWCGDTMRTIADLSSRRSGEDAPRSPEGSRAQSEEPA